MGNPYHAGEMPNNVTFQIALFLEHGDITKVNPLHHHITMWQTFIHQSKLNQLVG